MSFINRPQGVRATASLLCAIVVLIVSWDYDFEKIGFLVTVSFLVNAVVVAWVFIRRINAGPPDLMTVHLIAVWFMLVIGPMSSYVQSGTSSFDFFSIDFSDSKLIVANALVLIWTLVADFCYRRGWGLQRPTALSRINVGRPELVVQTALAIISLVVIALQVGIGVMTRQAFEGATEIDAASDFVLFQSGLRGLSYVTLVALMANAIKTEGWTERRMWFGVTIALALAIAVINNPIAAARFITGVVAISTVFVLLFRKQATALPFFAFTVLALLLVFPLLDLGRRFEEFADFIDSAEQLSVADALKGDTFRSYESIIAALDFVASSGLSLGTQLVGNILFFVPRAIWPQKPIGSGAMLAEYFGSSFTNVACPLQCEALVNFGLLGVPVLASIAGFLMRRLDSEYGFAARAFQSGQLTPFFIMYPFLLGFTFFITRGDFLTPFSSAVLFAAGALPMLIVHLALVFFRPRGH